MGLPASRSVGPVRSFAMLSVQLPPALQLILACAGFPATPVPWSRPEFAASFDDIGHWDAFIALVDRHRVPALAYAALRNTPPLAVPPEVLSALRERDRVCRLQALHQAQKTVQLVRAFDAQGISVLPLKGVVLSKRLFSDFALRQSKDIDLLVHPEDFDRAEALLIERGFRRIPILPGLSPTPRQERYLRALHYHYEYVDGEGTQLELHWRRQSCSANQMALLWAHTQRVDWMGTPILELDDDLLLLFLCDHGAHHRWFRAKWLGDVAVLLARREQSAWDELFRLAATLDVERPLLQAMLLVHWLYAVKMPPEAVAAIEHNAVIHDLALDALEALAGTEADGLLQITTAARVRFFQRLRKQPQRSEALRRLALSPYDFRTLRLPDALFWAYVPLRPVLWLWRHTGRAQRTFDFSQR